MQQRDPLTLMNAAQVEDYCDWLARITRNKRGSLAEKLRNAAAQIRQVWSF